MSLLRKLLSLLILLVITTSCQTIYNTKPDPLSTRMIACPWTPEETQLAIDKFEIKYRDRYLGSDTGKIEKLHRALGKVHIECRPDFPFKNDDGSKPRYAGLTISATQVIIAAPTGYTIGRTALTHELVHIVLWNLEGFGDPNHEAVVNGERPRWTADHNVMIQELDAELR